MAVPFIRPYDKSRDFSDGLHVFFTTIDQGVNFEPARSIGSYLWYKSYVMLSPETCFVLDDGNGKAVGYIIGTPDTTNFARRWKEILIPCIDPKLVPPPNPGQQDPTEPEAVTWATHALYSAECSMLQDTPDMLAKYPAHLHINILPDYQRKKYGPELINTFFNKMKELGVPGVHLGAVRTNIGAKRFYDRLGFQICDAVLDKGESGEVGINGVAICLVRKL